MIKLTYLCLALLCGLTLSAQPENQGSIQRVRIDFKTPQGYVRHLLLGFTSDNKATDAIDYGYDARNNERLPVDLNWITADERFVIQVVGAFDATKVYPFGMFLTNAGPIEISLTDLENFAEPIPVFIYDAWENTYHRINDTSYKKTIESGVYQNRFFISFNNIKQGVLSNEDMALDAVSIKYLQNSKTLHIDSKGIPLHLKLYNLQGQLISTHDLSSKTSSHDLPLSYLQSQVVLTVLESDQKTVYKRILIN